MLGPKTWFPLVPLELIMEVSIQLKYFSRSRGLVCINNQVIIQQIPVEQGTLLGPGNATMQWAASGLVGRDFQFSWQGSH